jgi:hypothetical protein
MTRTLVSMIALSVFLCGTANAQLPGRLKQKAREALMEKVSKGKQDAGDSSRSRPPARKDKDREYPPGVSYSSLLNGVKILAKNGQFRLDNIQATFLPDDCPGGWIVLRTADGKELVQFDWKPDRLKKPYAIMGVHKITDLKNGETIPAFVDLSAPGDYVLDFYLPEEQFYTYPFSVVKTSSNDPFAGGDCYMTNGDWQGCGYLYYVDARADQSLMWKIWLRSGQAEELAAKVHVEIKRDADDEVVCTNRTSTSYSFNPNWTRYEFDMVFPEGKEVPHGTYFKAKDLLETDGAYTLTMTINGKTHGVWKFKVAGSKLNYTGRTARGEADPLTFIEGGRDAWWYVKE